MTIKPATDEEIGMLRGFAERTLGSEPLASTLVLSALARIQVEQNKAGRFKSTLLKLRAKELSIGYPPTDNETVELIDRALMEAETV